LNVLVNPTYTETFGIANAEAVQAGVPLVAFKVDGNPESAFAGAGILVKGNEGFVGLGNAVLELVRRSRTCSENDKSSSDDEDKDEVGELIRQKFSMQLFIDGYASFFLELVQGKAEESGEGGGRREEVSKQLTRVLGDSNRGGADTKSILRIGHSPMTA
jgi:glycosyltransferase involved in cell wall biosynthesis